MARKKHNLQEAIDSDTRLGQYSFDFVRRTSSWLNLSVFIASGLIFFSACKKDEDKKVIDEENPYGTIIMLQRGGQSPLWSPDGLRIAYLMDGKLYIMNSDGTGNRLLTSQIYETMKWSPTGTELAYLDFRGGPSALYKIGVEGNNEVKLIDVSGTDFSWSPDGERIAYESSGMKMDLFVVNKDGSGNHKVDISIDVFSPSFTPTGTRIMFNSIIDIERDLFLVGVDGSNLFRLESPDVSIGHAEMKGDESKIYFSGASGGMNWEIYEVNLDGTGIRNLTNGQGNNHKPHLSPDGKFIVFLSYRDDNDGVWIMHADGSNPSRITRGAYRLFPGSWSPDSKKLVFDDEVEGVQGIYVLSLK